MARKPERLPQHPNVTSVGIRFTPSAKTTYQVNENITINEEQHTELKKFIQHRLDFCQPIRQRMAHKLRFIDRELHGYIRLDDDDRKREKDNQLGYGPKTTDFRPLLAMTQIEDAVTYLMELINGEEGLYKAVSTKDRQIIANGLTRSMNEDADNFKHVDQYILGCRSKMKYNIGGWVVEWEREYGKVPRRSEAGTVTFEEDIVYQGNCLIALNMYNTFWDVAVPVDQVHKKGEFFGTAEPVRAFTLRRLHENGEIFGDIEAVLKTSRERTHEYLERRPDVNHEHYASVTTGDKIDWEGLWNFNAGSVPREISDAYEVIWMWAWLIPSKFGLGKSKRREIWKLMWVNQNTIMYAAPVKNAHGWLPICMTMPIKDEMTLQTRSYAERLIGFERFGANELNVHQRSARKALYGVTIYDKSKIPLMEHADVLGGKIPYNPGAAQNPDINKAILQLRDTPDTSRTMENFSATIDAMQYFLPTDIRGQVAGLERAVQYQVAAVIQGTNRRAHLIAQVINIQALMPLRRILYYNILQYRPTIDIINQETGKLEEYAVSSIIDDGIIFDIGLGLKGIDRIYLQESLKEIFMALLQSKAAQDQIDVIKLLNHLTNMIGDKIDLTQFRIEHPINGLPPEMKDLAFQLLQQATQQEGGQVTALSDFSAARGAAE